MRSAAALVALALGSTCLAQSSTVIADGSATIMSGLDPSDVAAIPEPEILGPPIGVVDSVPFANYDAAALTSSVLALVTAATDAQTTVVDVAAEPSATAAASETAAMKRSFVGGNTNIYRRDVKFPIDTKSFVSHAVTLGCQCSGADVNKDIPSGYTPAFINSQGATQGRGYLTYKTLKTYDPSLCTAACDGIKTCVFANIYYEKDPDAKNNPFDVIKCSLYSMYQTNSTATNKGQWRGSFQVLITGSNGYNKAASPNAPAGYSMQSLPAAVNAPIFDSQGQGRFIQPVYLDTYSTDLCAAACDKQTQWDKSQSKDGCNYKTCVYANLYMLNKDGAPQTVVCALYTQATDSTAANNKGYSYRADFYQVSNSVALVNTGLVQAGYPMYCDPLAKDVEKLQSIGGDFCTSYLGYSPSLIAATFREAPAMSTVQVTAIERTTETITTTIFQKRSAIPTPSFIANWPAKKISAVCSQVATGSISTTITVTASTPYVTETIATSTSAIVAASTQTCKAELFTNGDFSNGANDWEISGSSSYNQSERAVYMDVSYISLWSIIQSGIVSQNVEFDACSNGDYTFSFSYKAHHARDGTGYCDLLLFGGVEYDYWGWSWSIYTTPDVADIWQEFSATMTPDRYIDLTESKQRLSIQLRCAWYMDASFLMKDFSLRPAAGSNPT